MKPYTIIGAGLAGCECAITLANRGFQVRLIDQKPHFHSEAHVSDVLSELVCSNSLRSNEPTTGVGLLKAEMRLLGSNFIKIADQCAVPAGKALAVNREIFSRKITDIVKNHPLITFISKKIDSLDDPLLSESEAVIIAAGPLVSTPLSLRLAELAGQENCYFYDAIAPIIWTASLNSQIIFRASRYSDHKEGEGDYLNCPMNREEYENFYNELLKGEIHLPHGGEAETHFEGCMPIEALAARGPKTLAFGPMKPVGLIDPRTGKRPWAVVQLRAEQANLETCNLVGFQTKLKQSEQERIFRLIPGLEKAEFARYGSMHRNTFINAPLCLTPELAFRARPNIYVAGQLSGVEGYVESAATGLWLGLTLSAKAKGNECPNPPETTALGALLAHLRRPMKNFQPSNITFGLMPELKARIKKAERKAKYMERAQQDFQDWLSAAKIHF